MLLNRLKMKLYLLINTVSWRDIVVVLLLNTLGALLNALHYFVIDGVSFSAFYASIVEYVKVYNLLGFALMFAYLALSPGPDAKLGVLRVLSIGGLAFLISLPFSLFMFGWGSNGVHPLLGASTYLLGNLLLSAWAIFVIIYIKRRESQIKFSTLHHQIAQTTEQRDKAELELHLLQAQLEPHFFFNTLANLHNLIDLDGEKAKYLLEELTEYLRSTIPQFRQRFITLKEELDIVERFLTIQQIRFGKKLRFTIQKLDGPDALPILPMSVLTLVENAIKHGVERSSQGGVINITAIADGGLLKVTVSDDANMLRKLNYGTGLSNLKDRLHKVYGNCALFELQRKDGLTIAKLEFPQND
ncbi:sensor histidine kinase [Pseudoalteromonas sp. T1lg65]|uniref:sensor histidine kinase n=1 Tax=Pseudoalteromonas sp. T1lg65 TaxID=2077101 RepID=UPI003F79C87C